MQRLLHSPPGNPGGLFFGRGEHSPLGNPGGLLFWVARGDPMCRTEYRSNVVTRVARETPGTILASRGPVRRAQESVDRRRLSLRTDPPHRPPPIGLGSLTRCSGMVMRYPDQTETTVMVAMFFRAPAVTGVSRALPRASSTGCCLRGDAMQSPHRLAPTRRNRPSGGNQAKAAHARGFLPPACAG